MLGIAEQELRDKKKRLRSAEKLSQKLSLFREIIDGKPVFDFLARPSLPDGPQTFGLTLDQAGRALNLLKVPLGPDAASTCELATRLVVQQHGEYQELKAEI
eukprot:COSAG04_NODE_25438_length_307_cov_1.000000_1_plen_101_part_11